MTTGGPAPSAAAFRRHLRRLDGPAFAAFVADLWAARGYEVTPEPPAVAAATDARTITVRRRGEPARRLRPVGGSGVDAVPSGVDVVVAATDAADHRRDATAVGAAHRGPAALHEMLRYAVSPPDRERLCRTHFGRPPAALSPGLRVRLSSRVRSGIARRPAGTIVTALVLASLVSGAAAVAAFGPTVAPPTPDDGAGEATTTTGTTAAADGTGRSLPPGLAPDGVVDVGALAAAHTAALDGQPHRYTLVYRGRTGPGVTADRLVGLTRRAVVAREDRYRATETTVRGTGDERVTRERETYADGRWAFTVRRGPEETSYDRERLGPADASVGPFGDRTGTYVRYLLSTEASNLSRVVGPDGDVEYRVHATGAPGIGSYRSRANYTATARVTESGLVRRLRATYDVPRDDGNGTTSVLFRFAVSEYEGEAPSRPDWVTAARTATANRTTTASPTQSATPTRTTAPTQNGTTATTTEETATAGP
ncbi:MAG: hypothetical protein ABEJ70_04365 [Halobacteriaceae archaeon]